MPKSRRPSIDLARSGRPHDLIKGQHDQVFNLRIKQAQQERRRGQLTGNGHALVAQLVWLETSARDNQRSATPAQGTPRMQQAVALAHMDQGVEGDLGRIKLPLHRQAIERIDIFKHLGKMRRPCYAAVHQCVKNKGVVGTR
jgi:hypothetical protein